MDREIAHRESEQTFGILAEQFLAVCEKSLRLATVSGYKRHLKTDAKRLQSHPINSITQAQIATLLNDIAKRGAVTANRCRATLTAFFSWAMGEGIALANPVANTNKREEKSRDRVLSDAELKAIWTALGEDDYGRIVKLLMLTGQRADEIAGLRWNEIGEDVITFAAERVKNKREHVVPLSEVASAIIPSERKGAHVFGRDDTGFQGWSKCKARLDEKLGKTVAPWRVHDLRRTVATGMAKLKVQPHVIEVVLNHASGHKAGVAGIYNRFDYLPEKTQALALWADHITAVVPDEAGVSRNT
jgi:integrase